MLSHLTIEERQQQTCSSRNNVSVFIATNCLFACFGGRGRGRDFNVKEVKQVFFFIIPVVILLASTSYGACWTTHVNAENF